MLHTKIILCIAFNLTLKRKARILFFLHTMYYGFCYFEDKLYFIRTGSPILTKPTQVNFQPKNNKSSVYVW